MIRFETGFIDAALIDFVDPFFDDDAPNAASAQMHAVDKIKIPGVR